MLSTLNIITILFNWCTAIIQKKKRVIFKTSITSQYTFKLISILFNWYKMITKKLTTLNKSVHPLLWHRGKSLPRTQWPGLIFLIPPGTGIRRDDGAELQLLICIPKIYLGLNPNFPCCSFLPQILNVD